MNFIIQNNIDNKQSTNIVRIASGVSMLAKKGSIANIYNRQGSLDAIKHIKE
jgi:hypothetical protein